MPKLVRLYIAQVLAGFGLSAVFVTLLIGFDVAGLRHLVLGTDMGWLGGVMLVAFHGIVFAGVQFGISIMRMAEDGDPDEPPRGRRQRAHEEPGMVAVRARPGPR